MRWSRIAARLRTAPASGSGSGWRRVWWTCTGGSITASSEGLGKGSTFIVRLPLSRVAAATHVVVDAGSGAPSARVLIAEDNVDGAEMLAAFFVQVGCQVKTVHDGHAALRVAGDFRPDIMVLDIGLPGMDGHDACRHIRTEPWGSPMRIVALTGWGQEDDRRRSKRAGFDAHFVKPVDPDLLLAELKTLALHGR